MRYAIPILLTLVTLLAPLSASEPDKPLTPNHLSIAGVQFSQYEDISAGIKPFGSGAGYRVALLFSFPLPITDVENCTISTALTDTGRSILPPKRPDRIIRFPHLVLSHDRARVLAEAQLMLPPDDVTAIRRLAGTLNYSVGHDPCRIDLGIRRLQAGAQGDKLNAHISSLQPLPHNQGVQLILNLNYPPYHVKSVTFLDAQNRPLPAPSDGAVISGLDNSENCSLMFQFPQPLPPQGRVLIETWRTFRSCAHDFEITDFSLLGKPLHAPPPENTAQTFTPEHRP